MSHPPHPPLVLRVGIVGHRSNPSGRLAADESALRESIGDVLDTVARAFDGVRTSHAQLFDLGSKALGSSEGPGRPELRLISALAEGADLWGAAEARKRDFSLHAVLPFERSVYLNDFQESAGLEQHRELRDSFAQAVFEIDGDPQQRDAAYEAAASVVVAQSDLLIAVWDGEPARGRGGTGATVARAQELGIPIVHIPWNSSGPTRLVLPSWRVLERPVDLTGDEERLRQLVVDLLLPPAHQREARPHEPDASATYFLETQPRVNFGALWTVFRDGLRLDGPPTLESLKKRFCIEAFEGSGNQAWGKGWEPSAPETQDPTGDASGRALPSVAKRIDDLLRAHYAWSNGLSIFYGNLHRSSYVLNYLLGALAVICAIGALVSEYKHIAWLELTFTIVELVSIGAILVLTWLGRSRRWHERWIDYRTLAERLRQGRFQLALGGGGQEPSVPGHLAGYGNPAASWVHWHYRAIERAVGLVPARLDGEYLRGCQRSIGQSLLEEQRRYHRSNAHRLEQLDHRLHTTGNTLFLATCFACSAHLLLLVPSGELPSWAWILTTLCGVLPVIGAATAALRSQGEYHRIAQRSLAMEQRLEGLHTRLASMQLRDQSGDSASLRRLTSEASDLMIGEVLDWRIVFKDRPLVWPA